MKLDDYQALAIRTAKQLPTQLDDLAHAGIGFVTEIGEYASEVKRITIYGKPATDEMRVHMAEEIGDLLWYIALALNKLQITMSDAIRIRQSCIAHTFDQFQSAAGIYHGMTLGQLVRCMARDAGQFLNVLDTLTSEGRMPGTIERNQLMTQSCWLLQWCAVAATKLEMTLADIASENIHKLRARYPDTYSDIAAEARADKGGADHRSS